MSSPELSPGCALAGQMWASSSSNDGQSPEVHVFVAGRQGPFQRSPLFTCSHFWGGGEFRLILITVCTAAWCTLGLGFVLIPSSRWSGIQLKRGVSKARRRDFQNPMGSFQPKKASWFCYTTVFCETVIPFVSFFFFFFLTVLWTIQRAHSSYLLTVIEKLLVSSSY